MSILELIQLHVMVIAVVALAWRAPSLKDTAFRWLSGERGCLLPQGLMSSQARIRRASELQAVIARLSLIARMNLPMCRALEAAAVGESRRISQALIGIGRQIHAGDSVSHALAIAFRGCPVQLTQALRAAEASGQLALELAEQERRIAATIDERVTTAAHVRNATAYASIMALFTAGMVSWIAVFLMPKFKEIFLDFDVPMPRITALLIEGTDLFATHGVTLLFVLLLIVVSMALLAIRSTKSADIGTPARIAAALRSWFPFTRIIDDGLGLSRALRAMARDIRAGMPGAFAESLPKEVCATNRLRHRLAQFVQSISEGVAPHQAAKSADLGQVVVCSLRMVERGEDPERALRHAADYHEAIAFRWWHALSACIGPLVTLTMGALVGFIAIAMFMPLISLINAVSESL